MRAGGDFGLGEAFGAVRVELPAGEAALNVFQLAVGRVGELAPEADPLGPALGEARGSYTVSSIRKCVRWR